MSKAQTIRDALKANPTLTPKEIADKLGGGVTGQYVSLIRYQDKKAAGKKSGKKKASRKTAATVARTVKPKTPNLWPADLLDMTHKEVADFVRKCGGFVKARGMLDALELLQIG